VIPHFDDPVIQKSHNDEGKKMLLASFRKGLGGSAGKYVKIAGPSTIDEAVRIAVRIAVSAIEAEQQERRKESFYLDSDRRIREPVRPRERQSKLEGPIRRLKPSRESDLKVRMICATHVEVLVTTLGSAHPKTGGVVGEKHSRIGVKLQEINSANPKNHPRLKRNTRSRRKTVKGRK
jgi:hypothetical protein